MITRDQMASDLIEELEAEIKGLRAALEFVRTDPCFQFLGSVTHDTVTDALGLTNILANQQQTKPD
jgi:hypothetical protein